MTLEFDNLPLTEVGLRAVFGSAAGTDESSRRLLVERLGPDYDSIQDLGSERNALEIHATCQADGLEVVLSDAGVYVYWLHDLNPSYIRFERMKDVLERSLGVICEIVPGDLDTKLVGLRYRQFVASKANEPLEALTYLNAPFAAIESEKRQPYDIDLAWRGTSGTDFRVELRRIVVTDDVRELWGGTMGPEAFLLSTSAGRLVTPDATALGSIVRAHDDLMEVFLEVVTKEALRCWGYHDDIDR